MAVLVLDGHSRAAIETMQSLGRAGVPVDIAAEMPDCLAFHSRYAAKTLQQPSQACGEEFHSWTHRTLRLCRMPVHENEYSGESI